MELNNLSVYASAEKAMAAFIHLIWKGNFWYYFCNGIIFTGAQPVGQAKYAVDFVDYILQQHLGTVTTLNPVLNWTGKIVTANIWHPNYHALEKWAYNRCILLEAPRYHTQRHADFVQSWRGKRS